MVISKYTILKYYIDMLKTIENNALSINETTDTQLNQIKKFIPGFVGAFSSDNEPVLRNNESCIMNTKKVYNQVNIGVH